MGDIGQGLMIIGLLMVGVGLTPELLAVAERAVYSAAAFTAIWLLAVIADWALGDL